MDTWQKIKKYLSKEGERCIIIEAGQPSYLVTRIEDKDENRKINSVEPEIEKINSDINEWKTRENQHNPAIEQAVKDEEIKVENLPF